MRLSGASIHHALSDIGDFRQYDWEIKAADTPFDSLDDLLSYYGLPNTSFGNNKTVIEVLLEAPGEMTGSCEIKNSCGTVMLRVAAALKSDKIKLGHYHTASDGVRKRGSLKGNSISWTTDGDCKIAECSIEGIDAAVLHTFLSYDGIPLHRKSISDPHKLLNARLSVHRTVVDSQLQLLRDALFAPFGSQKNDTFEAAVSTLFCLLGFSVTNYGIMPTFRDLADIIAYSSVDEVAVVECTVAGLNYKDKLSKLVQRTKVTKDGLAKAGYSHLNVQPVIITLLSNDEVQADLSDAGNLGVAVLTKESLELVLSQVEQPHRSVQFLKDLKRFVPRGSSPDLWGNLPSKMVYPKH